MGPYFKVTKKFIMSEAIADVKGKAKDSLDELCSMVETLLVSTYSTSYSKISQNFWFKVFFAKSGPLTHASAVKTKNCPMGKSCILFFTLDLILEWKRREKGGSYP